MQRFIAILTLAQMETSLTRLDDAQKAHEEMMKEEKEQSTFLLEEIARVQEEGALGQKDSLAQIYLDQLNYDLKRITINQARRLEMMIGRRKTIELFMKWDQVLAA